MLEELLKFLYQLTTQRFARLIMRGNSLQKNIKISPQIQRPAISELLFLWNDEPGIRSTLGKVEWRMEGVGLRLFPLTSMTSSPTTQALTWSDWWSPVKRWEEGRGGEGGAKEAMAVMYDIYRDTQNNYECFFSTLFELREIPLIYAPINAFCQNDCTDNLFVKLRIFVRFVFEHFPGRNLGFGFFCSLQNKTQKEQYRYTCLFQNDVIRFLRLEILRLPGTSCSRSR